MFLYSFFSVALLAACSKPDRRQDVIERVESVDEQHLKDHVEALTGFGPRSVKDVEATRLAVEYIRAQLSRSGYDTQEEAVGTSIKHDGESYSFVNIIAERRGSETPELIYEIGAHYDTVDGTPGADDNASAVAAVLEIARLLSTVQAKHTVRFCFFALEEHGRDGSLYHVRTVKQRKDILKGAIIFEMIAYATDRPDTQRTPARIPILFSPPRTGNFIAVVGNFRSGGLGNRFEAAVDEYVPGLPYFSANRVGGFFRDALRSDHKPYWDHGYKAVMLTDTANFRNPNYHLPSDTPETLNFAFLKQVTQAALATVLQ
jgi:Zn-dependent M28 family amino/carboxypeptidase